MNCETRLDISAVVKNEADAIIAEKYRWGAFSPWHINTGWCFELAERVSAILDKAGIEHEVLDNDWLVRRGPNEGRPSGVGRMGIHEFLFIDGRYYDAECPEGVDSPYEMPIVKSAVASKHQQAALEAFLANEDTEGPFPCPPEVAKAFVETWEAFRDAPEEELELRRRTFCIASQNLMEPIAAIVGEDVLTLAHAMARVIASFGIDCELSRGSSPTPEHLDGEHSWVRFVDGSVLDIAIEGTEHCRLGKKGGLVIAFHRDEEHSIGYERARATMATVSHFPGGME